MRSILIGLLFLGLVACDAPATPEPLPEAEATVRLNTEELNSLANTPTDKADLAAAADPEPCDLSSADALGGITSGGYVSPLSGLATRPEKTIPALEFPLAVGETGQSLASGTPADKAALGDDTTEATDLAPILAARNLALATEASQLLSSPKDKVALTTASDWLRK